MNRRSRTLRYATVGVALLGVAVLGVAGPTYAVDGVIEINQVRAGQGDVTLSDSPGFPVTIDRAGSYRLTGDLSVSRPDQTVIEITAGDVTLDLNGFTISCGSVALPCSAVGGAGLGIDATGESNIHVLNGTIRGMGNTGMSADTHTKVKELRAINNGVHGISVGNGSIIDSSIASGNDGSGISAADGNTIVTNCTANVNDSVGISVGSGSTVRSSTANANGNNGIGASQASTLVGNTLRGNGRLGIETGNGCTIRGNSSSNNKVGGIYCNGGCAIVENTVYNNENRGISTLGGATLVGNAVSNNEREGFNLLATDGFSNNVLTGNNGGNAEDQTNGGVDRGANLCGTRTTCP